MRKHKHKVIWLQPWCSACAVEDRLWCQDNVWEGGCECGAQPVKYVLAPEKEIERLRTALYQAEKACLAINTVGSLKIAADIQKVLEE